MTLAPMPSSAPGDDHGRTRQRSTPQQAIHIEADARQACGHSSDRDRTNNLSVARASDGACEMGSGNPDPGDLPSAAATRRRLSIGNRLPSGRRLWVQKQTNRITHSADPIKPIGHSKLFVDRLCAIVTFPRLLLSARSHLRITEDAEGVAFLWSHCKFSREIQSFLGLS